MRTTVACIILRGIILFSMHNTLVIIIILVIRARNIYTLARVYYGLCIRARTLVKIPGTDVSC